MAKKLSTQQIKALELLNDGGEFDPYINVISTGSKVVQFTPATITSMISRGFVSMTKIESDDDTRIVWRINDTGRNAWNAIAKIN